MSVLKRAQEFVPSLSPTPLEPGAFIVVHPQQKYAENTQNANLTTDEPMPRLVSCLAHIAHLRSATHGNRPDSALTLEMLRRTDEARSLLENILNDFLADQQAGLRSLNLEELRGFLRAEGDNYDERGHYVRTA